MNHPYATPPVQSQKLKFPVGGLLLAIYALFYLLFDLISMMRYANVITKVWNFTHLVLIIVIAVSLLTKKRGSAIFIEFTILLCAQFLFTVLDIVIYSSFVTVASVLGAFFGLLLWGALVWLALCDKNAMAGKNQSKKPAFVCVCAAAGVRLISNFVILCQNLRYYKEYKYNHYYLYTEMRAEAIRDFLFLNVLFIAAIVLIALWLYKPEKPVVASAAGGYAAPGYAPAGGYFVSIGKHVCLLLFTFGIWQYIWIYRTAKFTKEAGYDNRDPVTSLLLCMFIPFYLIYWTYVTATKLDQIARAKGVPCDLGTICLILAIFVGFVPPILMQDKINAIVTAAPIYAAPQQNPYAAPQQNPYAAPQQNPYAAPQQNPYAAPQQNPYASPQQNPYAAPQQPPYAAPQQNPYAAPQQNPYAAPQQNPYAAPQQNPYAAPATPTASPNMAALQQYQALLAQGVITREEYEQKRKELLGL